MKFPRSFGERERERERENEKWGKRWMTAKIEMNGNLSAWKLSGGDMSGFENLVVIKMFCGIDIPFY